MSSRRDLPAWASMTRVLLRMWERYETVQFCGNEALHLVQIDRYRTRYHRIPSFTD